MQIRLYLHRVVFSFFFDQAKINKLKNPWVPMNTHRYLNTAGTRIMDTREGTGWAQLSYLSNGAEMGILLSVPIDTPRFIGTRKFETLGG